ncbi:hypothetical protein BAE44_0010078 [Dichanthelium oligosanthes]|uniref:Uncharacterized protein n=1 Tax=Dichanthelium oligosanthes TaxID=888268 RepID=A0A1E5VUU5_9POAL|nr:hypothetical protein BAE44_0010078 [Dichanthelium oligosanthes]
MGSGNLLMKKVVKHSSFDLDIQLDKSWMEDVTCPICLDYPHNAVLLRCTSYEKGCRPFVCDTDQTRSNCLERFKGAYELPANVKVSSGDVIGWIVIGEARMHLNQKKRQVDWDNFQQSSDIVDVLSTIHAQVPNGIVLGDYVIESRRRARARERRGSGRRNGSQANLENYNLEVPAQSVELREIRFDEIDDEYIVTGAIPSIAAPGRMASFHYSFRQVSGKLPVGKLLFACAGGRFSSPDWLLVLVALRTVSIRL